MDRTQGLIDGRVPALFGCPSCQEHQVDELVVVDEVMMMVECQGCGTVYDAEESYMNRSLGRM